MEAGKKVMLQVKVDEDLANVIKAEAKEESRDTGPHVAHVLKKHYSDKLPKSHVPKQQYES